MEKMDGHFLRKLREERGWSLREFAEKIYTSKSTVQRWEQSYVPENEDILNNISRLFGIGVEDMRAQSAQEEGLPPEKLADALNCKLPPSVAVLASAAAPQGFDANRSAKKKTYVYNMYASPRRNPLKDRYSQHIKGALDISLMRGAAALFVGEHDFKAYCASRSQVKTTVRTVYSCGVEAEGEDVRLVVCGGGFLYNMVRTMAGTAVECALGRLPLASVVRSLEERDRALVGKTMPAKGLVLLSVDYGRDIFGEGG